MGTGPDPMSVQWASSAVFACANTAIRRQARGLASEWLARERVALLSAVQADKDMKKTSARGSRRKPKNGSTKWSVSATNTSSTSHPKASTSAISQFLRIRKDTQSALSGADVWGEAARGTQGIPPRRVRPQRSTPQLPRQRLRPTPLGDTRQLLVQPTQTAAPIWARANYATPSMPLSRSNDIELVGPNRRDLPSPNQRRHQPLDWTAIRIQRAVCSTCGRGNSRNCHGHPNCSDMPASPLDDCTCTTTGPGPQPPPTPPPGPEVQAPRPATGKSPSASTPPSTPRHPYDDLVHLLRELTNRIDDGIVKHINQTTQVTITGEEDDAETIKALAEDAKASINVIAL